MTGAELFQVMTTAARKFPGGDLMVSKGVDKELKADVLVAKFVILSLTRHLIGDWGDVGEDAKRTNDENIRGGKLVSIYEVPKEVKSRMQKFKGDLVAVTEANRKETLLMWYSEWEDADKKQVIGNAVRTKGLA